MDCIDGDIPVSAILTSASLHDSQAVVPLVQINAERITNLYGLMDAAIHKRFCQRSSVERANSYLKDNHGGRNVRVRGAARVMTHLMFGIIVIAGTQLFHLLA